MITTLLIFIIISIHFYLMKERAKLLKLILKFDLLILIFIAICPIDLINIDFTIICWLSVLVFFLFLRYQSRERFEILFDECKNISSFRRRVEIEKHLKVKFEDIKSAQIKLLDIDDLKSIKIQEIKYKYKTDLVYEGNFVYKNPYYLESFSFRSESVFDKEFLVFWYFLLLEVNNNLTYKEMKNLTSLNYNSPNKEDLLEEYANNQIKLNNKFLEEIKC